MTSNDGHDSPRGDHPVMDTVSGSRSLPFRLEQALLTDGPATANQFTVVYGCMAAQLDADLASFRRAAIASPTRAVFAPFEEHWDARARPCVKQLRALCSLVETLNALLTVTMTPLDEQLVSPHPPLQGLHGKTSPGAPTDPHAPVISPKAAGTPPPRFIRDGIQRFFRNGDTSLSNRPSVRNCPPASDALVYTPASSRPITTSLHSPTPLHRKTGFYVPLSAS